MNCILSVITVSACLNLLSLIICDICLLVIYPNGISFEFGICIILNGQQQSSTSLWIHLMLKAFSLFFFFGNKYIAQWFIYSSQPGNPAQTLSVHYGKGADEWKTPANKLLLSNLF